MYVYCESMDTIQKAQAVLRTAEESLRDLIRQAMDDQRYSEIKDVAELADGVAKLIRGEPVENRPVLMTRDTPARYEVKGSPPPPTTKKKPARRKRSKKSDYPWFGRDGDRLVKVGWSKKNKKEYEHRVSRDLVQVFATHLLTNVSDSEVFDVEGLLPVIDSSGDEVPAYQVYVALAWLRSINVIEKKGRDGYVLRQPTAISGDMNEIWNSLRTRSA